jgi:hypothetical protein
MRDETNFEFVSNVGRLVTYNPYKYDSFVIKATEKPVGVADVVAMKVMPMADGIKRGVIYMRNF